MTGRARKDPHPVFPGESCMILIGMVGHWALSSRDDPSSGTSMIEAWRHSPPAGRFSWESLLESRPSMWLILDRRREHPDPRRSARVVPAAPVARRPILKEHCRLATR